MSYISHVDAYLPISCRFLAKMYKSEALVALDRIADAVRELNPEAVNDVSVEFPDATPDQGV